MAITSKAVTSVFISSITMLMLIVTGFTTDSIAQNDPTNLRFEINGNGFTNSAWLSFSPGGSFTQSVRGDAVEFPSFSANFIQLATTKVGSSELLDINHLPNTTNQPVTIPLAINYNLANSDTNDFVLTITQINLPDSLQLIFNDNVENRSLSITNSFTYTIPISNSEVQNKRSLEDTDQISDGLAALSNPDYSLSILPADVAKPDEVIIYGSAGWRLLSIPKSGASLQELSDNTSIQGVSGAPNADAEPNVFMYDDSGIFEQPATIQTAIPDGYGLGIFFFDNTMEGSSELPLTLGVDEAPPTKDVPVNLNTANSPGTSAGAGAGSSFFTLVGNPFASHFDLNSLQTDTDQIQDHVHFWDAETSSYLTRDRTTPFIIAPWQAFWVEVASGSSTSSLTFPVSGKTELNQTETIFKNPKSKRADIRFSLLSEQTTDRGLKIAFRDYATIGFDRADAAKLTPLSTTYATAAFKDPASGTLKSVESLPYHLDKPVRLQLDLSLKNVAGDFTLNWEGFDEVPNDINLILRDLETNERIDMRFVKSYTFEHRKPLDAGVTKASDKQRFYTPVPKADSHSQQLTSEQRFEVLIQPSVATSIDENSELPERIKLHQNYPNPFNPSTNIRFELPARSHVLLSVYNINGQEVAELVNGTLPAGPQQVSFNAGGLSSGVYMYRLETDNRTLTRKMILIK